MSSIARILLEQGKYVSGSDLVASDTVQQLRRMGATVFVGHDRNHVNGAQLVVASTAIDPLNPELLAAKERGIPVVHRSEIWAHFLNAGQGIAVAGAHGKTTVTAMTAWVLHHAGADPTFLIGGELPGLGSGHAGRGPVVVAEADESDASFLRYRPWCSVLTHVEPDHLEHYGGDYERLVAAYGRFLAQTRPDGLIVVCGDDAAALRLAEAVPVRRITYGLRTPADLTAVDIVQEGFLTTSRVLWRGETLGTLRLRVPGKHNVENALAVTAVCQALGLGWDEIAPHLATYGGARRRFEVVAASPDFMVVDDYAHHPSEVRATLAAAREGWPGRRIIAVFQPHRYARVHFLLNEFATAFGDADYVLVTEIYAPAAEPRIDGASGRRLAEAVQARHAGTVEFVPDASQVPERLAALVQRGDIVITLGAGDIWKSAREFARLIGHPTV